MDDLPDREEAIFEALLRLPDEQRAAHLRQACGADVQLRQGVETLLQAHAEADGFLDHPSQASGPTKGGAPPLPLTEQPGDRIGRYKLLQQIGEGGCGVVYMAEQEEPVRRRVALKVIKLGMDTKSVIARFEAERQALALMDHPNIARVLDAGATETGRPYFVMELVRGIKITDYCDENDLPTSDRLALFNRVCHAIQHAHQKGIIHRDIKPSNILVTLHDGVPVPKVIDFGIAKATQGRLTDQTLFTAFEQFIGTPAYMSPEQAEMSGLDIDTRTDIYALGVLLYELLTGQTPFDAKELMASGLDAMRRVIREVEPVKPSTRLTQELAAVEAHERGKVGKWESEKAGVSPTSPADSHLTTFPPAPAQPRLRRDSHELQRLIPVMRGDLDWIVMKCLEKDRTHRYETANGLAMDIERHLGNEPVVARPPSRIYRLQKLARRNRGALLTASALTLALLLALVVLAVGNVRIGRERNQKEFALEATRASERRAKDQLFLALRNQAQARRYSRQMGQRFDSLAALAEAARIRPDEELRDDVIAALALPDVRRGASWPGWPPEIKAMAFDNSYQRYAWGDDKGLISIRSIPDNQELQQLVTGVGISPAKAASRLLFSPDGRFLARIEERHTLRVSRLADGKSVLQDAPEQCGALAFSQDSRHLAVGQGGWIRRFSLAGGEESNRWPARSQAHVLAFSPDNRKLAVGYVSSQEVSVYDTADGALLAALPVGTNTEPVVAWHPDSQRLAVGGSDPRIQIWDVDATRKLATLEGHAQQITILSFHPEGALLASGSWDGVFRLWDPASGRQLLQLPCQGWIGFSQDGRWLGVTRSQGLLGLLEVVPNREYRTIVSSLGPNHGVLYAGDISPDGRILTLGMDDGVRLWELASGRELAFLSIGNTPSTFFRPDGQELVTCGPEAGLQKWPVHTDGLNGAEISLGPSRPLELPFVPVRASPGALTQKIAVVSEGAAQAMLLDLAAESSASQLFAHPQACFVAVSGDARWLASSGWHSDKVRLWNTGTGGLVREWAREKSMPVFFTPDSQNLIISSGEAFSFWDVNTLREVRRLPREVAQYPGHVAFSTDGKMMALEMAPGMIHLKDVLTGRTVAKLEDPSRDQATWMAFSPDGRQLVVAARFAFAIHVWDLGAIRARLKTLGLDWDWPEFPTTVKPGSAPALATPSPLRIQVLSAGVP